MPRQSPPPSPSLRVAARVVLDRVREAGFDALALLVPVTCAGCGAPDRAVCVPCLRRLAPRPERLERAGVAAWAAHEYGGTVATAIGAFKDGGRTDARGPLAGSLLAAVRAALVNVAEDVAEGAAGDTAAGATIELCAIPSTRAARRSRGYDPVRLLTAGAGLRTADVLVLARRRDDQAALGAEERRANADGALAATERLAGRRFLIVDDVLTTGSTVAEAARALRFAGGEVVGAAVIAQTPRRTPPPATHSSSS